MNSFTRHSLFGIGLLAFLGASATLYVKQFFSPTNTVIVFDLDDVLLFKPRAYQLKFILDGWNKNPFNYFPALTSIKNARTTQNGKKGFYDDNGNEINGLTFQILHVAVKNETLRRYAAKFLENTEGMRYINKDTLRIIKQLKAQGYTIAFATNKDRISYDYAAQYHGRKLTKLPDMVFVAHPGNSSEFLKNLTTFIETNKNTLPQDFVELVQRAVTVQPSDTIYHAPTQKPNTTYYNYVLDTIGRDKHVIFVDDKNENATAFESLHTNEVARIGIHFKDAKQLKNELRKHGVLTSNTMNTKIFAHYSE